MATTSSDGTRVFLNFLKSRKTGLIQKSSDWVKARQHTIGGGNGGSLGGWRSHGCHGYLNCSLACSLQAPTTFKAPAPKAHLVDEFKSKLKAKTSSEKVSLISYLTELKIDANPGLA